MKTHLKTLSVALVAAAVAVSPVRAQSTLTFETPGLGPYYPAVPSQGGFDFNGFRLLNALWWSTNYPGAGYAAFSGTDVIWGHGNLSITSGNAFFLNYLYFGAGWTSNLPITISGKRNGATQWSQTIYGGLNGPQRFELGAGVAGLELDEIAFQSESELYLDDFTTSLEGPTSLGRVTATPEPVTLALLGSGLAGIGGVGALRRRRKST